MNSESNKHFFNGHKNILMGIIICENNRMIYSPTKSFRLTPDKNSSYSVLPVQFIQIWDQKLFRPSLEKNWSSGFHEPGSQHTQETKGSHYVSGLHDKVLIVV